LSSGANYAGGVVESVHTGRWVLTLANTWSYVRRSQFQEIAISEVDHFGTCLFLDGWLQLAEADEYVYHEHLVLPALLAHERPRRVLVLGGGDGLAAREALRHPSVNDVVMVDIDEQVVEVCQEYLAHLQDGALSDPRVRVVIDDARHFLQEAQEGFDIILVDLVDFMPETQDLFRDVVARARPLLNPGGILVSHGPEAGPPLHEGLRVVHLLASFFQHVDWYRTSVPSFGEGWSFVLASDDVVPHDIPTERWTARSKQLRGKLRSFSAHAFPGAFYHGTQEQEVLARLAAPEEAKNAPPFVLAWATLLDEDALDKVQQAVEQAKTTSREQQD